MMKRAYLWFRINIEVERDGRTRKPRTESGFKSFGYIMSITKGYFFVSKDDMRFDKDIISGLASFEIMIGFKEGFFFKYIFDFRDFSSIE